MWNLILKAEDGEYVLSEHSTEREAVAAAEKIEPRYSYPEQQLEVREDCITFSMEYFGEY